MNRNTLKLEQWGVDIPPSLYPSMEEVKMQIITEIAVRSPETLIVIDRNTTCSCDYKIYDKYIHVTTVLVSSDVNYNLLVTWHDLLFINVWS